MADVDNDGYVDFYFGTGDPQMSRLEPNRFFRNNGNGTFSDMTRYVGFARPGNKGHGVAFVDLNGTGALILATNLREFVSASASMQVSADPEPIAIAPATFLPCRAAMMSRVRLALL